MPEVVLGQILNIGWVTLGHITHIPNYNKIKKKKKKKKNIYIYIYIYI